MDSSKRAVESYWRSRMIDAATSDEDKVTPGYKLDEISELLRSSHVSIVKEVAEFVLKRLDHKSPIVKQKTLRLIKYVVGKCGAEFRREMQRNSVAIRQLFHYKGEPDPLKGDALNKAVRDTAHEAISAVFAEDNNISKPSPAEDLNKRIQGFGNTNFEMPSDDKKSFLSEVVGIGCATIKQGISNLTQSHSFRKNDNGDYKGPTLRKSLTTEIDNSDRYEPVILPNDIQGVSKNTVNGPWGQDVREFKAETKNGESSSNHSETRTREERLLETIVTSGGVRLQPTRDAIQAFLVEAAKLDASALSHALESKLLSPIWQVRMKAMCVLESILRKKEDEHFLVVASYFMENIDVVSRCSESPQASLREKANKVLNLLNGEQSGGLASHSEKFLKAEMTPVQMPDLIDTGDQDDYNELDNSTKNQHDQKTVNLSATPHVDDLFGDGLDAGLSTRDQENDDDPFADVSFHTGEGRVDVDDLFSGVTINNKSAVEDNYMAANKKTEVIDIFGTTSEAPPENQKNDVSGVMVGLSVNENSSNLKQKEISSEAHPENVFSNINNLSGNQASNDALSGIHGSQAAGMNANMMFPLGTMPYAIPPGIMMNPAFSSQPMNYGAMESFFAQQQLLATMSNLQHFGNYNAKNAGINNVSGGSDGGSPLPDIFQSNFTTQMPSSMINGSKKEDTRAFDFISDHLAAARDPKRTV
ncbi:hypothetical protein V6N13_016600 [Hibiscus sabdariffa]|uniref:VHS domain-containing protein n=1 Tax=Hibiscus sabdariffa TaxID=183260 RepID=A0ABR2NMY1_9ROSI